MNKFLVAILVLGLLEFFSAPVLAGEQAAWWDGNYLHRKQITITNNAGSTLESGYTVNFTLD
ncbi:MAG: hypothetical protein ABH874_00530, partial [Methanobacteriota archaeon]